MSLLNLETDMDSIQQSNSVYQSDEFRLFCHKILPCSKRTAHDWASCPFAHPGEKAKRRNIRTHQYDCEMCEAVTKGEECKLGSNCTHAHNVFESWLHPQKYRTMMCKDRDRCTRPVCFFAHGIHELRTPTGVTPVQSDLSQNTSALAAFALEQRSPAAGALAAASTAVVNSSNWGVPPQQTLMRTLAGHLARGTSNASAMSGTMGASGCSTPTANNPALIGGNPVVTGAMEMPNLQLLANLMRTGNAAGQQDASAQQQQQLRAMAVTACATSTLPVMSCCGTDLIVSQNMSPGSTTVLQLPGLNMMMSPQQQQTSAECLRQGAAAVARMVSNTQAGFASVECSDASSSNLSDLSATLSLLTTEQVAQMYGVGVPLRSDSVNSSGPLVWPPQLAHSTSGGTLNMLGQPWAQTTDPAGTAYYPVGIIGSGNLANVNVLGSSLDLVAFQQPQQQMVMPVGQWYRPAATQGMMQAPATYMVASSQQGQMQQQTLLQGMPVQNGAVVSSQAAAGAMPCYLN